MPSRAPINVAVGLMVLAAVTIFFDLSGIEFLLGLIVVLLYGTILLLAEIRDILNKRGK